MQAVINNSNFEVRGIFVNYCRVNLKRERREETRCGEGCFLTAVIIVRVNLRPPTSLRS